MAAYRIIALAPNDWDGLWMNRQQLLTRLSSDYSVLYSIGARTNWDHGVFSLGVGGVFGRFVNRGRIVVDHPPHLLLRLPGFKRFDRIAIRLSVERWRRQLDRMGTGPIIAYIFNPEYEVFLDTLAPDFLIYQAYDLYSSASSWNAQMAAQQARLVAKANLVIASSTVVAEDLKRSADREIRILGNGVDYQEFADGRNATEPDDLARIPHPRIGHIGRLNQKVDIDLVIELATRHPEWQFVLVGPVLDRGGEDREKYRRCESIPNVHLLGIKSREDLPRYTAGLDVGMMAYRAGALWTKGIYPLKLHEYLACGLPVVSADIPTVRDFGNVLEMANTADEWSAAIQRALNDNRPELIAARQTVAKSNSWEERVHLLEGWLSRMIAAKAAVLSQASSTVG